METSHNNPNDEHERDMQTPHPAPEIQEPSMAVVSSHGKKRGPLVALLVILVLALTGAAAWWFWIKSDTPSANTGSNSNSQSTPQTASNEILFNYYHEASYALHKLNLNTKADTTVNDNVGALHSMVQLTNGKIRTFTIQEEGQSDLTQKFVFRDNNEAPKVVLSRQGSTADGKVSITAWAGPMAPDGSKGYYFERNNLDNVITISSVDYNGTVNEITSTKGDFTVDGKALPGSLTPEAVSADGKTLYLEHHTCLNCDGPSHANIISLDLATKQMKLLFADPTGAGANTYGLWYALNSRYFVAYAVGNASNLGDESYEQITARKDYLYLFDTQTNTATKIIESTGDKALVSNLQLSANGKTFYYYTQQATQGKLTSDSTPSQPSHQFTLALSNIYGFDIATSKSAILDLGLDKNKDVPIFLSSNTDKYVLATQDRQPIFSDTPVQVNQTRVIYTAPLSDPTKHTQIYATPGSVSESLAWQGFVHN